MPRFFFNVIDNGSVFADEVGANFPDVAAAETAAKTILLEIARDEIPQDGRERTLSVQVINEAGVDVLDLNLDFSTLARRA